LKVWLVKWITCEGPRGAQLFCTVLWMIWN